MRSNVDDMSLIAQTAPSPTANGPPCGGTRMLSTTRPAEGRGKRFGVAARPPSASTAAAVEELVGLALTRVSVFDAKLLTQTEPPAGAIASAGTASAGRPTRIGRPAALPERTSILVTVP